MNRPKKDARILLLDIETAPRKVYVWGHYEQDVLSVDQEGFMLSFAYKWLGSKKIVCRAIPDFGSKISDKKLVKELHDLLSQADVCIAHNGDNFDLKYANTRFVFYGLQPYPLAQTIDTLKIARRRFRFPSNKLDDICTYCNLGRKLQNPGKQMWLDCLADKPSAWKHMRQYNKRDVELLEKFYLYVRSWYPTHPRLTDYTRKPGCPVCQKNHMQRWGWKLTATGRKQRYQCQSCGHIFVTGSFIKEV